jgi:pimeloyl-ACP methyl ester carboxylesterase
MGGVPAAAPHSPGRCSQLSRMKSIDTIVQWMGLRVAVSFARGSRNAAARIGDATQPDSTRSPAMTFEDTLHRATSATALALLVIASTSYAQPVASATREPVMTTSAQYASATSATSRAAAEDTMIRPFRFRATDAALAELRRRIASTQWPEKETVADESQGVPLATMKRLAQYWATDYDWRKGEAKLNAFPQFVTSIDGLDIHFLHVRSRHPNALPLVITHGWPGSIIEQLKIIDPLVNPTAYGGTASDAFHVVIPSMPGYGFTEKPTSPGWGPERMGRAWDVLMKRLGYTRYVAQGGDWGAFVVDQMGLQAPEGLLAIHTNMPATVPADVDKALLAGSPPPSGLSAEEKRAYEQLVRTFKQVDYAKYMAVRPQTLYGIADSPVGLAAWLLDHNDANGQPAAAVSSSLTRTTSATGELTRDEILDNITLYWLTNTGVSASRLYWEYKGGFFNAKGVAIPVAMTVFPGEQYEAPRSWAERAYPKLIYYNKVEQGGHFAAWEQPRLFAAELRAAFKSLR